MLFKIAHRYLEATGFGCAISDKSLVNLFQKNYTVPNSAVEFFHGYSYKIIFRFPLFYNNYLCNLIKNIKY